MSARRSTLLLSLCIGLATAIAYPYVDLALACRAPASEACVWGKAYFRLTMGVSIVVIGGAVSALVYGLLMWRRRRVSRDKTRESS
jgi:hypothetical protein